MTEINEEMLYEGVSIELIFVGDGPLLGDLIQICGFDNPNFPPTGKWSFDRLSHLGVRQVDDYFGIPSKDDEGVDVIVWLHPIIDRESVYHHPGPFTALELSYSVLRNPANRVGTFLEAITSMIDVLPVGTYYRNEPINLPEQLGVIEKDIADIVRHWEGQYIIPGSDEALEIEY